MKKHILRFSCILFSLLLLLGVTNPALPSLRAAAVGQDDQTVAVMHLCVSGISVPYFFGHSWICITNVGDETIVIGQEAIAPGQTVSVSTHARVGMEFNREMNQFRGRSVTAVRAELTSEALTKAENEILSSKWDNYSMFFHNCTHFCAAVWKAATGKTYATALFPFILKSQFSEEDKTSFTIV